MSRAPILLLTEVFPPRRGGSGRWMWELYRRVQKSVPVQVAAGRTPGAKAFDRNSEMKTFRLHLHFGNWGLNHPRGVWDYARALGSFLRIVRGARPSVIHCGKVLPEGLLATVTKRWCGIPYHCFAHGEELTFVQSDAELRRLAARVLEGSALVIANSQHTKRLLLENWSLVEQKVAVLHPGVDTSWFVPSPPSPEVRAALGWGNRRVILTVGALQQRKGQDMLIRALPRIRKRHPDVLYALAGEGWERKYLESLVLQCGVADLVQFRGVPCDDELLQCYQQCDLFVLPNRQIGWDLEGFGIALLEAQACGKPVIAGRSGGTSEAMRPSETGMLVSCDSPEELGGVVSDLLDDARRRADFGAQGRRWTAANFDWRALAPRALQLFGVSCG